jgi:hypothetical protein
MSEQSLLPDVTLETQQPAQFVIPPPFRAWCHICDSGLMSIDDLPEHNREVHRVWKG